MAAKKKAAPPSKPKAKKAPNKKAKTSSAPGESAKAHQWLKATLEDQPASKCDGLAAEIAGPTEVTIVEGRNPETGQFVKGYRGGPGRQKGSRNKFAEEFITDFYADWLANGAETIAIVRTEKPDQYLKVAAAIIPKQMDVRVSEFSELTEETLDTRLAQLAQELGVAMSILNPGAKSTAH